MDKTESETHDFMNVESFSQLPFIRPTPPVRENAGAIRLFGKEFRGSTTTTTTTSDDQSDKNNSSGGEGETTNKDIKSHDNTEITTTSSRKFECHYCCRNFPTSQALGGHQNAHKRERQHAKRAHLQPAMAHDHYSLMNYSRLGTTPALPMPYHSWNSTSSSRLYSSHGSYSAHQTNVSPLRMWRIPTAHGPFNRERLPVPIRPQIPLFNSKDDPLKPLSSIGSALSSQTPFAYESKPSRQDQVRQLSYLPLPYCSLRIDMRNNTDHKPGHKYM